MEDSMIDLPNLAFDEKIGNKRVRDDHGEVETNIGRLEKRPSGILGVNIGGDGGGDSSGDGGGGGIIESFISNVFHKNGNGIEAKEGEVDGEVKIDVFDFEVEDTGVDLGIDGGRGGGGGEGGESAGGGGGGIINNFISNMFNHNGNGNGGGGDDQGINDLSNKVVEKTEELGGNGGDGGNGGGGGWMVDSFITNVIHDDKSGKVEEVPQRGSGEPEILDTEKLTKKNDTPSELPSKPVTGRQLKPDDYSERVFFLNNN